MDFLLQCELGYVLQTMLQCCLSARNLRHTVYI